jgi:hypothetical protein
MTETKGGLTVKEYWDAADVTSWDYSAATWQSGVLTGMLAVFDDGSVEPHVPIEIVADPDWDGVGITLTSPEHVSDTAPSLAGTDHAAQNMEAGETLVGTSGVDVFLFETGFGHDTVAGFAPGSGDIIVLRKASIADIEALLDAAVQKGPDVVITLDDHNSLTLKRTALASLGADDFRFVA